MSPEAAEITIQWVYIEDADGTQATNATTNASGVLAEQVLTKETYRYLDGDTPTALTPHVVKVRKYGYLFTEFSISVDAKIEGVDFVGDNPFVVANEATAGAYTIRAVFSPWRVVHFLKMQMERYGRPAEVCTMPLMLI
jgi:hypothetical protein